MGKGCKKGGGTETRKTDTTGQRTHNKESTEDAQEATHENTSYILRWKPGRLGKDGAPTG